MPDAIESDGARPSLPDSGPGQLPEVVDFHTGMEAAEWLFKKRLSRLAEGRVTLPPADDEPGYPNPDGEADDLVKTILQHMAIGSLTPTMWRLIVAYLKQLDGPERWALLGLNESHRRKSQASQKDAAGIAFANALKSGDSESAALIRAYDAYMKSGPQKPGMPPDTYVSDSSKPGNRYQSRALQRMATVVRPALVEEGLLPKSRPGRPAKLKKK